MVSARRGIGVRLGPLLAAALAALAPPGVRGATAVIDLAAEHQVIRGFGGATAFQPPGLPASLTDAEMDTLFGNGPGQLGFTFLRIRIAEDDAWRSVELAHALGAKVRGAEVIATPWSPPAAMKSNQSLIDGFLLPDFYGAYAKYLNDFATRMAAAGASLYAISVQNEPDIDVDYESCAWTPHQMLDFCRNHAGSITATRLIAPESFQFRRNLSDPILNDPIASENVEIIGGHIYGGGLADYPLARSRGKDVWMTEHLDLSTDWPGALATAREIHDCLAIANYNAYLWWYLRRYYGPLGEDGVITKRGHAMRQFSRFVRPGTVRVEATVNPNADVHVSAYKGEQLVIVVINQGAAPVEQTFAIEGGAVAAVTPWVTSETESLAEQPALAISAGGFTATLPAASVTTFVGKRILSPPTVIAPPEARTVAAGRTVILEVAAAGEFLEYQWARNGAPRPGATGRLLTIPRAQPTDAGIYTVTVSNSGGRVTSAGATVTVVETADPGRLINLSTRSPVGAGEQVQIAGFVVIGAAPRPVLVRAAGPELATSFHLQPVLADPWLELHNQAAGRVIGTNEDWAPALALTFAAVNAFPWTAGGRDAALVVTLEPGAYTAVVRGRGDNSSSDDPDGAGLALVEVYSLPGDGERSRLTNLSTRSYVGRGDDLQIGGFVIGGTTAVSVVIRVAGPALNAGFGLNGVLADPVLSLYDQARRLVIATVDDWDEGLRPQFAAVGAFPWMPGSRDAALVTMLAPGAYTVLVRGKSDGTGLALLEIYERP